MSECHVASSVDIHGHHRRRLPMVRHTHIIASLPSWTLPACLSQIAPRTRSLRDRPKLNLRVNILQVTIAVQYAISDYILLLVRPCGEKVSILVFRIVR
jgi:hypothetical protein